MEESNTSSIGQIVAVDRDGQLNDLEQLQTSRTGGSTSLSGPFYGNPSSERIAGLIWRIDKRFPAGLSVFLQASHDLQQRFTGTAEGLGRKLNIYQLGF